MTCRARYIKYIQDRQKHRVTIGTNYSEVGGWKCAKIGLGKVYYITT